MVHFFKFSFIIAAACASFSAAAPLAAPADNTLVARGGDVQNSARGLPILDAILGGSPSAPGDAPLELSIPDIIVSLTAQLTPVLNDLKTAVPIDLPIIGGGGDGGVGLPVNLDIITGLLGTVQQLLSAALEKILGLLSGGLPLRVMLRKDGKDITILELSKLISNLLGTLFGTLARVSPALNTLDLPDVSNIIDTVANLVTTLLTTLLGDIPGLSAVLGPLLGNLTGVLKTLDVNALLDTIKGI